MKTTETCKFILLASVIGVATFRGTSLYGGNVFYNQTGGDWNSAANWYGSILPSSSDQAIIPQGASTTIDSADGTIANSLIGGGGASGWGGTGIAFLNLAAGGSLNVTGTFGVQRNANGTVSSFNMSGGTLSSHVFSVGNSSSQNTGTATIIGGILTTYQLNVGYGTLGASVGSMVIQGSGATIATTAGNSVNFFQTGTLQYDIFNSGISVLNASLSTVNFNSGSTLVLDGSSYTGGANTFTLLTYGTLATYSPTIDYNSFSGYNVSVVNDTTDSELNLVITPVPEPGIIALVVAGFMVATLPRTRNKK